MSSLELKECFIGKKLSDKCNVRPFTRVIGLKKSSDLKHEDQKLVKWRCEVSTI